MIRVQDLKKFFGQNKAVNGVSFTVEKGEVLGFLGPNGAGKSTTMRMITGFIPPTEGEVSVGGFDVVEEPLRAKQLIGYLPENAPAYAEMTVHGFLSFVAELRGLRGEAKKTAVADAKPETTGLDKPTTFTVMTENGFTYVLKVGKEMDEHYPLTVVVSASIPTTRASAKEEKAEEKTKLDKEFQIKREALEKKLAKTKDLRGVHFSSQSLASNNWRRIGPICSCPSRHRHQRSRLHRPPRRRAGNFAPSSRPDPNPDSGVRANEKPGTLFPRCRA